MGKKIEKKLELMTIKLDAKWSCAYKWELIEKGCVCDGEQKKS